MKLGYHGQVRFATANCYAKVNLGLLILERRPDGYHELRTIFQTIGLHDRLRIEADEDGRKPVVEMSCDLPELVGSSNLAARAALAVLATLKTRRRVRLSLKKRIPLGSGLGGGSSDAATVLKHLPALLGGRLEPEQQLALAEELGADVPFFLLGGRAIALGRGTEVYPLPEGPNRPVVLVHPGLHVSTAEAYQRLDALRQASGDRETLTTAAVGPMISYSCGVGFRRGGDRLRNDFEPVVFSAYPELARLKRVLARAGASPVLLSGSGSAMFAMFDSGVAARLAAAQVRRRWPHWRVWITRTVNRRQFAASWPRE